MPPPFCNLCMISDLDMAFVLIFQCLAVALVGQKQTHLIALVANRGLPGQYIENDHVPDLRIKAFQSHDVMAF